MTLGESLTNKLQVLKDETAKLEAELATLSPSGILQHEIESIKAWFQAAERHLGM